MSLLRFSCALIALFSFGSVVLTLPLLPPHNPLSWDVLIPKLNVSLVDACYYHRTEWQAYPGLNLCHLISNGTTSSTTAHLIPDQFLQPLKSLYIDYLERESTDSLRVFACYADHYSNPNASKPVHNAECYNVLNRTNMATYIGALTTRESNAFRYMMQLMEVSEVVKQCYQTHFDGDLIERGDDKCSNETKEDARMVAHCRKYHLNIAYIWHPNCDDLQVPLKTAPITAHSIARRLAWVNATATWERIGQEYAANQTDPNMALFYICRYSSAWESQPDHPCWVMTRLKDGHVPTDQEVKGQDYWFKQISLNWYVDCHATIHNSPDDFGWKVCQGFGLDRLLDLLYKPKL